MKHNRKSVGMLTLLLFLFAVARAQNIFIAAGKQIVNTPDGGTTWAQVWDGTMESKLSDPTLTSITYGNGKIVAAGGTLVISSDNGKSWKEIKIGSHTGENLLSKYTTAVAYGDGMFVLAFPLRVLYSTDGENWSYVGAPAPSGSAASGGDGKKGGGLGRLKNLADNLNKVTSSSGSSSGSATGSSQANPAGLDKATDIVKTPMEVSFINGKFFVTGGNRSMEMAVLVKSGSELKLEKLYDLYAEYGNAATLPTGGLASMATDGKAIVVAARGSSKSATSLDGGATWKFFRNPQDKQTNSICYGNGTFVGVNGFGEVLLTSTPATGWSGSSKFYRGLMSGNKVMYDGSKYWVFCHDSQVFTSTDAKEWTQVELERSFGVNYWDAIVVK
ncbi:MAG: hypothetical protein JSS79_11400 [Bacteroidetes bacterium]|nr:hypothetical protein [Bacteroidota bacterium]